MSDAMQPVSAGASRRLPSPQRPFRIESWVVQPASNTMTRAGETVRLEPKVMQVLVLLAEQAEYVVSRDALIAVVWPDTAATDDVVSRCISELRKVFADDPRQQRIIRTVRKKGYQLIAPVRYALNEPLASTMRPVQRAAAPAIQTRPLPRRWSSGPLALFALSLMLLGSAALISWVDSRPPPRLLPEHTRPLTSYPGLEFSPALSPDGTQVAFAWSGTGGKNVDLYVKLTNTATRLRLTEHPAMEINPVWSPDGTQIAFVRLGEACGLYTIPALGGPERLLTACSVDPQRTTRYPDLAWAPNGEGVVYSDLDPHAQQHRLYGLSLETLTVQPLTSPPPGAEGDHSPAFSRDGKTLAFTRAQVRGIEDVYRVPVAGGTPQRLTFNNWSVFGLDWTADGRQIVFSSGRGCNPNLWRIPAGGGTPAWVPAPGGGGIEPSVARDGAHLVYTQQQFDTNIWRLETRDAAGAPIRLHASTRADHAPQFSPDGTRLAFVSDRSGSLEVWVSQADGSTPTQRTTLGGPYVNAPHWSPDGTRLAFEAQEGGQTHVYVVALHQGTVRRLTSGDANNMAPRWSIDGQSIYIGSDRSGTWQIWREELAGGPATPITYGGGFTAAEAPDGRAIYYAKRHTAGLWKVPVGGGRETLVLEELRPLDWGSWGVLDDGIFFPHVPDASHSTVMFYDFATGGTTPLATLPRALISDKPGLSVSPDRQWVLYVQGDRVEGDLMLVEHFR